jgi:hypothetical protein
MKAQRSAATKAHSPHVRQSWVDKDRQGPGQARWRDSRMRHLDDEYQSWRQGRWEVFADELDEVHAGKPQATDDHSDGGR